MSVKRNEADQELAKLVGAWEWWKDATHGKDVVMKVEVERTYQKGVFAFTAAALDLNRTLGSQTMAKVTRTYPNASRQRFGDFFLGLMMSIGRMVDDCLLDVPGETRTPR
jgi:hypothetical protein